jgi:hypothetical protein
MDFDRRFWHDDLRYRDNIRQTFFAGIPCFEPVLLGLL